MVNLDTENQSPVAARSSIRAKIVSLVFFSPLYSLLPVRHDIIKRPGQEPDGIDHGG